MPFRRNEPYNELPLLPPPACETARVLRAAITASRALAELKGAGNLIPNQAILINSIPLQEAQFSAEIENIVTTQDALFRAAVGHPERADPQTREVLHYRAALRYGYEAVRAGQVSIDLIIALCSRVLAQPAALRDEEPILVEDKAAGVAVYTPPRGRQRIVALLGNLVTFLQEPGGLDPLLKMAAAHYQFEAIHPFADGNGRTGRTLNILALQQAGLLDLPVIYLSRTIIRTKQEYYRRLRGVTEERDWEGWLLYMLAAVEETARWTTGRIAAICELQQQTAERCRRELPPRMYSRELVDVLVSYPYCRVGTLVEAGIAKRETASAYLRKLTTIGVLTAEKRGRDVVYRHPALLQALTG